jgi:hypothetical protein
MIAYACLERFDAGDKGWLNYLQWLGRNDLASVVAVDGMLCPPLVRAESEADWQFTAREDFLGNYLFSDLDFLLGRAALFPRSMIVAAIREPSVADVSGFSRPDFEFVGFDVSDRDCCVSALLNCGGFPDVFSLDELSPTSGLILSHERAFEIRDRLHQLYPEEAHADCFVWALWRRSNVSA